MAVVVWLNVVIKAPRRPAHHVRFTAQAVCVCPHRGGGSGRKPEDRSSEMHLPCSSFVVRQAGLRRGCKPNSVCIYLSDRTRNLSHLRATRSGPLLGFLFGLAPDGVFRAASLALRAVGSYPTFSPLPRLPGAAFSLWHCPSGSLATSSPACIPAGRPGYAASRPVVFGLSSPARTQERFSAPPQPTVTLG